MLYYTILWNQTPGGCASRSAIQSCNHPHPPNPTPDPIPPPQRDRERERERETKHKTSMQMPVQRRNSQIERLARRNTVEIVLFEISSSMKPYPLLFTHIPVNWSP